MGCFWLLSCLSSLGTRKTEYCDSTNKTQSSACVRAQYSLCVRRVRTQDEREAGLVFRYRPRIGLVSKYSQPSWNKVKLEEKNRAEAKDVRLQIPGIK